jgi:tetratricopeptide (TPR) repeat protein/KaiC/GvpD/RAD55 family RecA-like ATPase
LEDVHWADSASLALLHYISRVVSNSEKILVLATFRSEEVTADAEGRSHPLKDEMRAMSREDLFSEIKLPNLSQVDFSLIAQNMMGGRVQQALVEKIAEESNGNALFLVESLRMLVERNGLVQENNEWRLAVDYFGIPSKIRDIILRRLAVLNYAQRRVLDAAAVIGEKFNVELLASVLKQDSLDVLDILNFIARSTALVGDEGVFYKFDHARSREVLYEELSPSLKTGYHYRVAERLESRGKSGKLPFADLAYHYAQAGNEEKAAKYSLEAGLEALATFSNGEAIKNFQYVIDKVADHSSNFAERTAALEGLGDALYASNNFRQARETFEQLAQLQKDAAKLRALRKAIVATYYEINPVKIKELTLLAEEYVSADRVEAARVLSHKARVNSVEGKYVECYPFLQEAINVYEEEYCLSDVAWDLFAMSNVRAWSGELEKGVACALRSLAIYDELGDVHARLEAHLFAGNCFGYCTLADEAVRLYRKLIEIDSTFKVNDYVRLVPACTIMGLQLLRGGDLRGAKMLFLKALDYCNKADSVYNRSIGQVFALLVLVSILEGDIALGEEYYSKFMGLPPEMQRHRLSGIHVYIMNAIYFASKNQFNEAHKFIEKLLDFVNRFMPCPGLEAMAKMWSARILKMEGRSEESEAMLSQAQQLIDEAQKKFSHVNIFAELITFTHPEVNQVFEIRLDVTNASTQGGSILRIDNLSVSSLKVLNVSPNCVLKDGRVEFKDNKIERFSVKTMKLTVMATRPESFNLAPAVTCIDDLGQTKTSSTRTFQINVHPKIKGAQVAGKITTGFDELDQLLLGGIPEGYAITLTSPSTDEKELLVKKFLEAGTQAGEMVFDITSVAGNVKALVEDYPSNFFLFVCNHQAEAMFQTLPNVFKLKNVENLTDIDIALTKAFRMLKSAETGPKRICIEILSDVLLQHHAVNTRRWLSALLPTLKLKGFTILAVVDPSMHPSDELQAILGVFDGEIRVTEKETPGGTKQTLKIRKLINQKYLDNEVVLRKEKLAVKE